MVDVDKAVIARLKSHGLSFEVLVDCDIALALKGGKAIDVRDALAVQEVFTDAHKGLKAPENQIKQVFKTTDHLQAAEDIIKQGDVQLTTEYRHKLAVEKRRAIIHLIHRNGIDPRTGLPHPEIRIENALEEARVHIDEYQPPEAQLDDILKKIRPILPIKFDTRDLAVRIPAEHAGHAYGTIKKFGKMLKEEWQSDGSWIALIEIPAGLQEDFLDTLNNLTHGNVDMKIMNRS